jgi:hypothetical protein
MPHGLQVPLHYLHGEDITRLGANDRLFGQRKPQLHAFVLLDALCSRPAAFTCFNFTVRPQSSGCRKVQTAQTYASRRYATTHVITASR